MKPLIAVDTKHHLIVEHEVTNVGGDHGQLSRIARSAKSTMSKPKLKVLADRGYFSGPDTGGRHRMPFVVERFTRPCAAV